MKTNIIAIVFAILTVGGTAYGSVAYAQETGSSGAAIRMGDNGTPVIYDHASTLEEGILRGTGDLLRGVGDMNYSNSLAMINGQEARARSIVNAKSTVQTWFDIRNINKEQRALTQKSPVTASDAARRARLAAPKGLTAMEFDTTTGRLVWPVALQDAEFASNRGAIDSLVAAHGVEVRQVKLLAAKISTQLKDHIDDLPTNEYMAAKRFLNGLQADAAYGPSVASR